MEGKEMMTATAKRTETPLPCFICGKTEESLNVQFLDKTFKGVLCLEHFYSKLQPKEAKQSDVKGETGSRSAGPVSK